ncbi:MAG: sensor domain-containing diguanylate cyclase [Oscillospiraceae bacterium]|nr:sensor domain-containing diguanylate cyclase [Oscillospiraceae bacterium]
MKNRIGFSIKHIFMASIAMTGLLTVIIMYSRVQESVISQQIESAVSQSTDNVCSIIDSSLGYALNSIQVVSNAVTGRMTSPELENAAEVLGSLISTTPFSRIEYIRSDGMNLTDAGAPFDASEREYYIRGITGESGIWINYHPKYSEEPLLNFYTPLYYNNKIAGVLTGTLGGNTDVAPMLMSGLYGQKIFGLLVDEENTIIASSETFKPGVVLNWDSLQISEENKQKFLDKLDESDGRAFVLIGNKGRMTASVKETGVSGWKVIHILSGNDYKKVMKRTKNAALHAVLCVLGICIIVSVELFLDYKRRSGERISKANSERDETISIMRSMNGIYYSVHLIDLRNDTAVEYKASGDVHSVFQNSDNKSASEIMTGVINNTMTDAYLQAGLVFSDVTTLQERMNGKKFIAMDLEGKNVGWIRMSFITIEADENRIPLRVVCTTQIIDEDKKREEGLIIKSNTDEMTGFYNRRAYEEDIAAFSDKYSDKPFVYVSADVNELKIVNDNIGHSAGDELICGAAECMRKCFGGLGKLYRTGGDEFAAILFADHEQVEKIKTDIEEETESWHGNLIESLSLSCGYAESSEFPGMSVTELSRTADRRMYDAKSLHYRKKGVDRRGRSAAHTALCALYTKILKINITDDTYTIVNMNESEQEESMGFSDKISSWLTEFGKSGQVHPDDLAEYLRRTDMDYLSKYFKEGRTYAGIHYRRKSGDRYSRVIMDLIPADDYTHTNQTLFLYVKSIDTQDSTDL